MKLLVFDFDGLILDTEAPVYDAWQTIYGEHGVELAFEKWAQCIGTDPVSGTNPRGCACMIDPVNGKLEWTCGSTNRWFLSE